MFNPQTCSWERFMSMALRKKKFNSVISKDVYDRVMGRQRNPTWDWKRVVTEKKDG